MVKVWKAKHTKIRIDLASAHSVLTTNTLYNGFTGTPVQLDCKAENITIVEPEGAIDKIDLIGVDASGYQCGELDEKPFDFVSMTGTLCHDSAEVLEKFFSASSTAVTSGTIAYTRWAFGNGLRPEVTIVVQLIDGTAEVNIALDNALITKTGDRKLDAADGHWQQDFEAKCLAADYYVEYRD